MPDTVTIAVSENTRGVPLTSGTSPNAPTVTPVVGQHKLQVTWSSSSGLIPSEITEILVAVRITSDTSAMRYVELNWGDGSGLDSISAFGTGTDVNFQHTYSISTPVVITATARKKDGSALVSGTLNYTPRPLGTWYIQQIQLERYRNNTKEVRLDWRDIDKVGLTFTDHTVRQGYRYKYRYRLRTLDRAGFPGITSQFSAATIQNPWS